MTEEELAAIRLLAAAEKRHRTFGKPAIEVPLDALHFYDRDGMHCVIDMEQIVFLAEEMVRKAPDAVSTTSQ